MITVLGMEDVLNQRIRFWRKRRKMTLDELARKLGTSPGHLHKWETGKVSVNLDRLTEISSALGIGIRDLVVDKSRIASIPVIGILDHFGTVIPLKDVDSGEPPIFVDAPDGIETETGAVIEVASDALQPIPNGWLLFFNLRDSGIEKEAVGNLCVVKQEDAEFPVVRRVGEGTKKNTHNLFSPRLTEVLDTRLAWATPVISLRPLAHDEEYP
jgi:transcriptional regulator with XRE-family HTH domain